MYGILSSFAAKVFSVNASRACPQSMRNSCASLNSRRDVRVTFSSSRSSAVWYLLRPSTDPASDPPIPSLRSIPHSSDSSISVTCSPCAKRSLVGVLAIFCLSFVADPRRSLVTCYVCAENGGAPRTALVFMFVDGLAERCGFGFRPGQ